MLNQTLKNAAILIVDDQEANVLVLERLLEREGYTHLKSIRDPRQVMALYAEFQPDLILLDLLMPHLDGFAVMEQLRSVIPTESYLPILVLTAEIAPQAKQRALSEGATDFLTKPLDVIEVLLRIKNLLETRFLHLQLQTQNQTLEERVRKRTAQLAEAEAKYRTLVEQIPVLIYQAAFDNVGSTLYVSPQIETLLGFTAAEWMAAPDLWSRQLHPDDRERVLAEFARCRQTGEPFRSEYRLLTRDSRVIWIQDEARVLEDGANQPRLQGAMSDITERKQAEEALAWERYLTRALMAHTPDAIYFKDAHSRFIRVNQATARKHGLSDPEQLVGKTDFDFFVKEKAHLYYEAEQRILQTGQPVIGLEEEEVWADGTHTWAATTTLPMRDEAEHIIGIIGMSRDITERKQAEADLSRRADEFAALYEITHDLAIQRDLPSLLEVILERAMALFGVPSGQFYLYDAARGDLELMIYKGLRVAPGVRLKFGEGMAGRTAQTHQPLVVDDYRTWAGRAPQYSNLPVTSVVQVPLLFGGELIGVLGVNEIAPTTRRFTEADIHLLTLFAGPAASAVQAARLLDETRRAVTRAEALTRTAARLNAQLDLEAVLKTVCEETAHALNVSATAVALYDEKREALIVAADFGLPREHRERATPTPRALYDEYAGQMGPLIIVPDMQAQPGLPDPDLYAALNVRTVASASMLRERQLVGTLALITLGEVRHFNEDELNLLRGLADQAAQAVTNARLFAETERRLRETLLLNRVIAATTSMLEPSAVLQTVCQELARAFDVPQSAAARLNADRTHLTVVAEYRAEGRPSALGAIMPLANNLATQYVIEHRLPLAITDVTTDPRMAAIRDQMQPRGTVSLLIVPLVIRDQVMGTLGVDALERREFSPEEITLAQSVAAAAGQALENARLFAETEHRLQRLTALRTIDVAISASLDMRLTLNVFLEQVIAQLGVDAADVLLFNPHLHTLDYAAGRGFRTSALQHTRLRLGEGYAGRVALERRTISIPNWAEEEPDFSRAPLLEEENFKAYYGMPLIAKGQVEGVMEIFHRAPLDPDAEWLDFLEALAGQAAIAIDNAKLFNDLQHSNLHLTLAYDATIEGWSRALDLRDKETEGHTQRVTEMTVRLAHAVGVSEAELVHVRRGALLHDIGKMGVPDAILLKPGQLTDEEWVLMRRHPTLAYEMLSPITFLRQALDIPYCHHEKWDGTGYPRGLRGEQIPLAARLFAVVDVWDALRSDRPYRSGWPEEKVREHIRQQAGTHFDSHIAEVFLTILSET